MKQKFYLCIDLKSFYASVECVERGLDPMTARLVVADPDRGDKTICLAVSPALKKLGVKNRCRVFEIPQNIDYITAPPRMKLYIEYAAEIYSVYLNYIAKEDIHVYSIDEVFIDVTDYLSLYSASPKELAVKLMNEIKNRLGIRAACGIGTNLYLTKIALDITAKHSPDFIGYLDEELYKKTLWKHKPITDFWRVGKGTAKQLESLGIYTMGELAAANEDLIYNKFGIDAELLIDHAWGVEPTTIADIKAYKSKTNCLTSGQVLMRDYSFDDGKIIIKEMMDSLCLEMTDKNLETKSVTLTVGYSNSLKKTAAHGTISVNSPTNAYTVWIKKAVELYEKIVEPKYDIRRITICCNNVTEEGSEVRQLSLFEDENKGLEKNKSLQKALVDIKKAYGKNAVFKGIDLEKNATGLERNRQIGGHKTGE